MEDEFKDQVRRGFAACKSDISTLEKENYELKSKLNSIERENIYLKENIEKTNSTQTELMAQIKGLEIAMNYIKEFNSTKQTKTETQEIKSKVVVQEDPYEALLKFKAKANKRDVLKNKMLSMISDGGMNLSELKFMFVDHFRYCSKATFYNYLKELKLERQVLVKEDNSGKSHIYLTNDSILNSI